MRQAALGIAAAARNLRSRAIYDSTLERLIVNRLENSYRVSDDQVVQLSPDVRIAGIDGGEPLGEGLRQFVFYPNGSVLGGEIGISGSGGPAYIIRLEPLLGRVTILRSK